MNHHRALFPNLFFLVVCTGSLAAQPTAISDEIQVSVNSDMRFFLPRAAVSETGDHVVAWTSNSPPEGLGVFARFYDDSGEPLSDELRVLPDNGEPMESPDVVMTSSNEALILWRSRSGSSHLEGDLFGQRFSTDGSPVGSRFLINQTKIRKHSPWVAPGGRIASSDADGFVVVWGSRTDPSEPDSAVILARFFDADGQPVTDEFIVPEETSGIQVSASVDRMPDGTFVVSWMRLEEDFGSGFGSLKVFARSFDAEGMPLSGDLLVRSLDQSSAILPAEVAFRSNGSFTLVWSDFAGARVVEARSFDLAGNPIGDPFQVNSFLSGGLYPALDYDDRDNLLVSWRGFGVNQSEAILVRQFNPSGEALGPEEVVTTTTTGFKRYSHLVSRGDGRFLVAWQELVLFRPARVLARIFQADRGLDPSLAGHWRLDEGSGESAVNSADNGLDGVLEQGTGWTAGQRGSAGLFDGIDDLVRVADSGATQLDATDALTLALWVRPDSLDGAVQVLVSKDNAYELEIGKLGARSWDLRLNNTTVREAEISLVEGIWQHLAMTWDGAEVCSYLNGLRDGCTPLAGTLVPNDNDLGLGARPSGALEGGPVFHFAGALDEVYVYNRAFTEDEIAALVLAELDDLEPPVRSDLLPAQSLPAGSTSATLSLETDEDAECRWDVSAGQRFDAMANVFINTGGTQHNTDVPVSDGIFRFYVRCRDALGNTNGEDATITFGVGASDLCGDLISHWTLEEGSGCAAADSFGPNPGELGPDCPTEAPAWVAGRGGVGGALQFDGGTDRVEVSAPGGFSSLAGVTVAAWIRHDTAWVWRSIVDHREGNEDGYDLFLHPDSRLFLRVNDLTLLGDRVVADGQWHHVVGTYDGTELRLYVDGVLDKARPAGATTIDVSGSLFLGRRWNNDQTPFAGGLDEVTVFGRGLSAVEVLDLYGGGLTACLP